MNDSNAETDHGQTIEQLQERYQSLNTRKIEAETNLKHAKSRLEDLQRDAREKYGTDNIDELREQLAKMKAENEKKRADYEASLDKIEGDLAKVEAEFAATETTESDNDQA